MGVDGKEGKWEDVQKAATLYPIADFVWCGEERPVSDHPGFSGNSFVSRWDNIAGVFGHNWTSWIICMEAHTLF